MAVAFWARRRQISFVFLFTLFVATLRGEDSSGFSFDHSSINASTIVVSIKPSTTRSTTTVSPTTTTVPPSTTLPTLPNQHRWSVTDGENVCLLLESGIRMKFNYKKPKSNELITAVADVPVDANKTNASGVCNSISQRIDLQFFDTWKLSLSFGRNVSDNEYHMTHVSLSYNFKPGSLPFTDAAEYTNTSERSFGEEMFRTDVGQSFVCTSQQTLLEGASDRVGLISVNFYDTQVEAFRVNSTSTDFHPIGGRCDEDEMNMLVPIIVGACLAGLIVIVLIAYFIGRHSKRGYENV